MKNKKEIYLIFFIFLFATVSLPIAHSSDHNSFSVSLIVSDPVLVNPFLNESNTNITQLRLESLGNDSLNAELLTDSRFNEFYASANNQGYVQTKSEKAFFSDGSTVTSVYLKSYAGKTILLAKKTFDNVNESKLIGLDDIAPLTGLSVSSGGFKPAGWMSIIAIFVITCLIIVGFFWYNKKTRK